MRINNSLYNRSLNILNTSSKSLENNCLNFIVIGDSHLYDENSETTLSFCKVLKSIKDYIPKLNPKFIIHTGDAIHMGNKDKLIQFKNIFENDSLLSKMPVFSAIGNHDRIDNPINGSTLEFQNNIAPTEYYFDLVECNTRFIFLNNTGFLNIKSNNYEVGFSKEYIDTNLVNVINDGISNGIKHFFITMHIPPKIGCWFDDKKTFSHTFTNGFEYLLEFLSRNQIRDMISGVFVGHIHTFGIQTISSIPILLTGGSGGSMTNKCYKYIRHHFLVVSMYNNGANISIVKYEVEV